MDDLYIRGTSLNVTGSYSVMLSSRVMVYRFGTSANVEWNVRYSTTAFIQFADKSPEVQQGYREQAMV